MYHNRHTDQIGGLVLIHVSLFRGEKGEPRKEIVKGLEEEGVGGEKPGCVCFWCAELLLYARAVVLLLNITHGLPPSRFRENSIDEKKNKKGVKAEKNRDLI